MLFSRDCTPSVTARANQISAMVCIHEESTNNSGLIYSQKKKAEIEKALERDHFMSSEEAKKFGIVDNVVAHRGE